MKIEQIVIYGHKLHSHTHSYIHNGFYIAWKHLGFKTYYFDDSDDVSHHDFSNTLFITEHQVNKKIPLRNDCLYLTHYIDEGDYVGVPKENIIILKVSLRDFNECDKDKKLNYVDLPYGIKHEYHAIDDGYHCLYMYWATDLLPEEIDENMKKIESITPENRVYFIGSVTHKWSEFYRICGEYGIPFINYGASFNVHSDRNISVADHMKLIQQSILAPALQDDRQVEYKYIPCRIFKNISYGKMGVTNNIIVDELFDNKLIYNNNVSELVKMGLEFEKRADKNASILELMKIVKEKHTYINRAHTIMKYVNEYTQFSI